MSLRGRQPLPGTRLTVDSAQPIGRVSRQAGRRDRHRYFDVCTRQSCRVGALVTDDCHRLFRPTGRNVVQSGSLHAPRRSARAPNDAPESTVDSVAPGGIGAAGEWPAALIPDEINSGRLRALVVLGAAVTTALPDTQRLRSALDQLDTLIVLDVLDTQQCSHASHVFVCHG